MIKKLRQNFRYLENGKSFSGEIKAFFIIFKGLSVAKNCLRTKSVHLKKKNLLIETEFFCSHSKIQESIGSCSIEKCSLPSCFEIKYEYKKEVESMGKTY